MVKDNTKNLVGQPIFKQMIKILPKERFDLLVHRLGSDRYYKSFFSWDQLTVMLFGIFARCDSMGEVCDSMRALGGKLNYLNMDCAPAKSTAGDSLRDRDEELFKLYYFELIEYFKPLLSVSRKERISFDKFYAFDSTTISLFSDVMKGVGRNPKGDGKKKGGLKVHMLTDVHADTAIFATISEAKMHDKKFLSHLNPSKGSMLVFDKAYNYYRQFAQWTQDEINFVCRLKSNARIESQDTIFEKDLSKDEFGVSKVEHILMRPLQDKYLHNLLFNSLLSPYSQSFSYLYDMKRSQNQQLSIMDGYVAKRIRKNVFFKQIDILIDWKLLEKEIDKVYKKGLSADGRPAYGGLLLFKMLLLGFWYNLSDERCEEMVNDSLSAMVFCGLDIDQDVPDHSVLSRFRTELTSKKAFDRLLKKVNRQLMARNIVVKNGIGVVDASVTASPLRPKDKVTYELAEDRKEDERAESEKDKENTQMRTIKKQQPGSDSEARFLKKGSKTHFGYKKHVLTDENGMLLSVHTTAANVHDSKGLKQCIENQDKKLAVNSIYGDKGYQVPDNISLLKEKKLKNRIQHKAYRNRPLNERQKQFNKLVSKKRWVVERTFGGIKRWFGSIQARYKGLEKAHTQHLLEAIAYNLYRSPGIIMSNALKAAN